MDARDTRAEDEAGLLENNGANDALGDVAAAGGAESNRAPDLDLKPTENGAGDALSGRGSNHTSVGLARHVVSPVSRTSSSHTFSFPGGPHSSLLRLFQSEMFDSRMCLHYLQRYSDSVGVQHYLCTKALPNFPVQEIQFLLPQLLHLLVVRGPEAGHELQQFLLGMCDEHHHICLMTLWLLQGYMLDFRNEQSKLTERGRYVAKLYQKIQALMFPNDGGPAVDRAGSSGTISAGPLLPILRRVSVVNIGRPKTGTAGSSSSSSAAKPANVSPLLVGISTMLAAVGLPTFTEVTKDLVMSQSKRDGLHEMDMFPIVEGVSEPERTLGPPSAYPRNSDFDNPALALVSPVRSTPSLEALSQGAAFLSGMGGETVGSRTYFQSTLKFFTTLAQISDRLRTVPKHARQPSLQAELELLNYNLPADVCLPMWCPAKGRGDQVWHHKIVAVAANDSVVLNSAERVPYLLLIEVLEPNDFAAEGQDRRISMDSDIQRSESPVGEDVKDCEDCRRLRDDFVKGMASGMLKMHSRYGNPPAMSSNLAEGRTKSPVEDAPVPDLGHGSKTEPSPISSLGRTSSEMKLSHVACPRHSIKQSNGGINSSFFNREYYKSVLDRRQQRTPAASSVLLPSESQGKLLSPDDATSMSLRMKQLHIHDEFTEKMKTAAILLAQLYQQQASSVTKVQDPVLSTRFDAIRSKIIKEMMHLEEVRRKRLDETKSGNSFDVDETLEEGLERRLREEFQQRPDDPSAVVLKEPFHIKKARIRAVSRYGQDARWNLLPAIVKSGADLRQEQLASQLLREFRDIWRKRNVRCWVKYYRVLPTSEQSGLVETVTDTISIHSLKKDAYARKLNQPGVQYSCYDWFVREFGQPGCDTFQAAQDCFMRSLAGYSLLCYVLNIKDRHNGNILVDRHGHLIHIDFGFMLANTPGSVGFEMAPFKLTQEYVDILGGTHSEKFVEFKRLLKDGLIALRTEMDRIITLVELVEKDSTLPCFTGRTPKPLAPGTAPPPPLTSTGSVLGPLKDRFHQGLVDKETEDLVDRLVAGSHNNIFTRLYDSFQYYTVGLMQ